MMERAGERARAFFLCTTYRFGQGLEQRLGRLDALVRPIREINKMGLLGNKMDSKKQYVSLGTTLREASKRCSPSKTPNVIPYQVQLVRPVFVQLAEGMRPPRENFPLNIIANLALSIVRHDVVLWRQHHEGRYALDIKKARQLWIGLRAGACGRREPRRCCRKRGERGAPFPRFLLLHSLSLRRRCSNGRASQGMLAK
jgi:hypothetical protein